MDIYPAASVNIITLRDVRVLQLRPTTRCPQGYIQACYTTTERNGSRVIECDQPGQIVDRELYYPFGGTAICLTQHQQATWAKTLRYTSKERDASGLYYYGLRYYAPWLLRWLNSDPAGTVEGLNLFRMVKNNPITRRDPQGNQSTSHASHPSAAPVNPSHLRRVWYSDHLRYQSRRHSVASDLALDFIRQKFRHTPWFYYDANHCYKGIMVISEYGENIFGNKYKTDKWTFINNFRTDETQNRFYSSHVVLFHIMLHAFFAEQPTSIPTVIKRQNVINKSTLASTAQLKNFSVELRERFLATPNGKMTQRTLDDIHASAVAVWQTNDDDPECRTFYISLQPKKSENWITRGIHWCGPQYSLQRKQLFNMASRMNWLTT